MILVFGFEVGIKSSTQHVQVKQPLYWWIWVKNSLKDYQAILLVSIWTETSRTVGLCSQTKAADKVSNNVTFI